MPAHRTARDRARAEVTAAIKDEARRQLADVGASGLSLRAVARKLGMVSSALYRYFPSRDVLLTELIIDAYNALGEAVEQAAGARQNPRERWMAVCHAARTWARADPHQYLLIYGTPVPGYSAPPETVTPAERVPAALLAAVGDGWSAGVVVPPGDEQDLPAGLREQAAPMVPYAPGVPEAVLVRVAIAWTQLAGMIGFELTGQLVGTFDPADAFFEHAVERMAGFVGFR